MPPDHDYPIFLHCPACGHVTKHQMIFEGGKYVDLVCGKCRKSAACAPKPAVPAPKPTVSAWPRYEDHEQ